MHYVPLRTVRPSTSLRLAGMLPFGGNTLSGYYISAAIHGTGIASVVDNLSGNVYAMCII